MPANIVVPEVGESIVEARVARWMKIYIASLIHRQRLVSIHAVRSRTPAAPKAVARLGAQVLAQTGFYPLERYQDRAFRWSETEAAMRIEAPAGRHVIRIECIRVREPLDQIDIRFYLDGRRVADNAIIYDAGGSNCDSIFRRPALAGSHGLVVDFRRLPIRAASACRSRTLK